MKRLSSLFVAFVLFSAMLPLSLNPSLIASAAAPAKPSALQKVVDAMQPGWNLGNTFDATGGDETSWGNPAVTKELIDAIAAAGFKSIRIPVTWQHRLGAAPDYAIDPAFMQRIQEVVDWSLDAGLYVMVNIHHDSSWVMGMETQHDEVLARFTAIWTQVAAHFKDYPEKLMFESVNEPRFSEDWNKDSPVYFEMLDELNTTFVHLLRKSGGLNAKRPLVLPTIAASAAQNDRLDELLKTIEKLNDKNLIATFHYYGYWQFSVNIAGATTFNDEAKADLANTFDRVYNTLSVKGIPVVVGEFGLLGFDKSLETIEHGEVLKFFEQTVHAGKEKGFALLLWDNGQHYDRRGYRWSDEDLYRTIMAGLKSRSSTAGTDAVFIKKDAAVEDARIPLNLNGNTFAALKNGADTLEQGKDYELDGDNLILKADLLNGLMKGTNGINAILNCSFSAGADWKLSIISYETPIMQSSEGAASLFGIPTQFSGDRLATMEATYADGSHAGPNDWTPFKEFNVAFTPNYEAGLIQLKPEFLDELKEGEEVTLKMHFWSGEVIPYKLTKQASALTGVSTQTAPAEPADEENIDDAGAEAATEEEPASEPAAAAPAEAAKDAAPESSERTWLYVIGGCALLVLAATGTMLYKRRTGR
ncbi:cellulase family glycosylhydrolase [Paenibacillus montanisoli]|uniref:Cellulase n=1 Tax=Paenibacillus montanisoli TaxID=2081970 RepID=A0A328U4X5_9BACL|nr:cellulase family glycosylhydrolase [Paenibacillus montanisoli]RAP77650.1 cellulase [Paenibacillus montanisoli]